MALTKARPQPRPTAPAVDVTDASSADTTGADATHISGYTTEDFQKFFAQEPELPPLPGDDGPATATAHAAMDDTATDATADAAGGLADDAESASDKSNRTWYQRWFGKKDADGPEQMEADMEMDDQMYAMSAQMATELTDTTLPLLIGRMHDQPAENYKATEKEAEGIALGWELYLRQKKARLTPLNYLIFKITIVYGVNFVMGVFAWAGRIRLYGFHLPWSDSWKRTAFSRMKNDAVHDAVDARPAAVNPDEHRDAPVAPWDRPPQTAPQAAPEQQPEVTAPSTERTTSAATAPTPRPQPHFKKCMGTGKTFEAGNGYPKAKHKTGKNNPDLIDKVINQGAYVSWANLNNQMGQQKTHHQEQNSNE